jgi:hypothetical protein
MHALVAVCVSYNSCNKQRLFSQTVGLVCQPVDLCNGDAVHFLTFFLIGILGGGGVEPNWAHSALRPPIGLLCQSRVMEKLVE